MAKTSEEAEAEKMKGRSTMASKAEQRCGVIIQMLNEDRPQLAVDLAIYLGDRFGDGTSLNMWAAFLIYAAVVEGYMHGRSLPCYDGDTQLWLANKLAENNERYRSTPAGEPVPIEPQDDTPINLSTYTFQRMDEEDFLVLVMPGAGIRSLRGDITPMRLIEVSAAAFQATEHGLAQCLKYRNHESLRALNVVAKFLLSKIRG